MEDDGDLNLLLFSRRCKGYCTQYGPSPTWKAQISIQHSKNNGHIIILNSQLTFWT